MTVNKRTKKSRQRGTHTHGWGAKKKHRGAGNRGGRGNAGTGKRADTKKPTIIKLYGNEYFGKKGFKIPQKIKEELKTINLQELNQRIDSLVMKGIAKKSKDVIEINLTELGYDKLLSKGRLNKKLMINVRLASKNSVDKVKKAGGDVVGLQNVSD